MQVFTTASNVLYQSKGSNAKYFLVAQKLMIYKGLDKSPIKHYLAGLFRKSTCASVQTVVEFHALADEIH